MVLNLSKSLHLKPTQYLKITLKRMGLSPLTHVILLLYHYNHYLIIIDNNKINIINKSCGLTNSMTYDIISIID